MARPKSARRLRIVAALKNGELYKTIAYREGVSEVRISNIAVEEGLRRKGGGNALRQWCMHLPPAYLAELRKMEGGISPNIRQAVGEYLERSKNGLNDKGHAQVRAIPGLPIPDANEGRDAGSLC